MPKPRKNKRPNPMGVWWRRMMQKVKPSGKVYSRRLASPELREAQREYNLYTEERVDKQLKRWEQ